MVLVMIVGLRLLKTGFYMDIDAPLHKWRWSHQPWLRNHIKWEEQEPKNHTPQRRYSRPSMFRKSKAKNKQRIQDRIYDPSRYVAQEMPNTAAFSCSTGRHRKRLKSATRVAKSASCCARSAAQFSYPMAANNSGEKAQHQQQWTVGVNDKRG